MAIGITDIWKEFNLDATKSMRESFGESYCGQDDIANYLDDGEIAMCTTMCGEDIFTKERIAQTYSMLTDGRYFWPNTLGYYIRKYNLRLPKDIEEYILDKYESP